VGKWVPRIAARAIVLCDQIGPRNWRVTLSCGHSKHVSKRVPAFQTSASCPECALQQPGQAADCDENERLLAATK